VAFFAFRALQPPELEVVEVRIDDATRVLAVTGNVEARRRIKLSPQLPGRITEILHFEGERVRAGEILAKLADPEARASVDQQQAALEAQRDELEQAQRDLERTRTLAAGGAVSKDELERANLKALQGGQETARLSAAVRAERSQLVLTAPFAGTIVRRDGEVGQIAGPDQPVFELATMDDLYVTAEVDERYVASLRPGMRAEVLPVALGGRARAATVSYLARDVDPRSGATTVRFRFDEPPEDVLVGASVDINVRVDQLENARLIPRDAVEGSERDAHVLVVQDGIVKRRDVQMRDWPAQWVVITKGLEKGELVVKDPRAADQGDKVRPKVSQDV
jgi:RND family efflux transporter MFP subunit